MTVIVLCATQIMKGQRGVKGNGVDELWPLTMLLNNLFANYVCRDGISIKLVLRVLPV